MSSKLLDPETIRIGENIKKSLAAIERDQAWLGRRLGVTRQSVGAWVDGKNYPKLEHIVVMATRVFKVTETKLIRGK